MTDLLSLTNRPSKELFFQQNDPNDVRLGEIVPNNSYQDSSVIILGCPQDEGIARNNGRLGAKFAPNKIREQFYKLTDFGISKRIFDLGDTIIQNTLEETHEIQNQIVKQILQDGKRAIILGGGNDLAYPNGRAMAEVFGRENWIAINIDAHFDVRKSEYPHHETPYRQLLEEKLIQPNYFYEAGFQTQANSPVYYEYLQNLGVNLVSLEQLRSQETADEQLRNMVKQEFIHHSSSLSTFFGFDLNVVRAADAPGTTETSPIGLRAGEFLQIVKYAGSLVNTKLIQFTEVNPNFDVDDITAKLVAIAMHRFCSRN